MNPTTPALGSRTGRLITHDNLQFRDLNGDGELNPYEDWRLTPAERAADLVTRMTTEEKAGLMVIGSHYPGYSQFLPHAQDGAVLNPQDVWRDANPITGQEYPEPVLVTSSTDNAINVRHQRYLICRDNLPPQDLATWTNAVQEVAERSRLGIPVVFASNPRNHVALVAQFGVNESAGVFSEWPNELGLAALQDPELIETFGREIAREWRAGGLHKLYGYMADVASEPRWSRFNGTFGEDVDLVTAYIGAVVRGMQGAALSEESVACTIKHFPGGGVRLDGHDPHFEWGQTNEYPTADALERYHLPPFQAACDAGAASIMPYYAKPVNSSAPQLDEKYWQGPATQFEEVAFAYNSVFLEQLLRRRMGHEGYVNSDSGVIDAMVWGVESLTKPERFAAAVRAGTDIFSAMSDPTELLRAVEQGPLADSDLECARTDLLHGQRLRRRRQPRAARPLLQAALETFERMGAGGWADQARTDLRAAGERVPAPSTPVDPTPLDRALTPQQHQIAQLAVSGATNQEIAGRLFLSVRTVEYHLGKVFTKLGIRSRRELRGALRAQGARRRP